MVERRGRATLSLALAGFVALIAAMTALVWMRRTDVPHTKPPDPADQSSPVLIADSVNTDHLQQPPCQREALERALAAAMERKRALLPALIGKARATPGAMFEGVTLGAPLAVDAYKTLGEILRVADMEWKTRIDDGKLVGFGVQVGWYDSSYPGTCDPAGPCDCIGPGDERGVCKELEQLLRRTWGKPSSAPRTMFGFEGPSDDAIWKTRHGRQARLTAWCELVFE